MNMDNQYPCTTTKLYTTDCEPFDNNNHAQYMYVCPIVLDTFNICISFKAICCVVSGVIVKCSNFVVILLVRKILRSSGVFSNSEGYFEM